MMLMNMKEVPLSLYYWIEKSSYHKEGLLSLITLIRMKIIYSMSRFTEVTQLSKEKNGLLMYGFIRNLIRIYG